MAHLQHHDIPRSLATSSRRDYAERLLRNHGLLDHFAFLMAAEDVARHKPDPEIYLTTAARHGIEPAALVVLEDSPAGVAAARAAGAFTIAIPHDHSPGDKLTHAHLVLDRLDHPTLLNLLAAPNRSPL